MPRPVTSPSNLFRRALCPGSERWEAQCEEPPDSDEAVEGRLLHDVFAGNPAQLSEEQQQVIDRANEDLATVRYQSGQGDGVVMREHFMSWGGLEGTADYIEIHESGLVVIDDLKTGRVEVTAASDNWQCAAYAVLAKEIHRSSSALVAISQPRRPRDERLTMAFYDAEGLESAKWEIMRVMTEARNLNAPLVAGEKQCAYCKAAANLSCPAFRERFAQLEVIPPDKLTIGDVPAEELKRFFIACRTAARIQERVKEEVIRRIEAGDPEFADYALRASGNTRTCIDVVGAYGALKDYFQNTPGFDGARFTDCTAIVWGKLEELVKELTGFSGERCKKLIASIIEPYVSWKPKNPSPHSRK